MKILERDFGGLLILHQIPMQRLLLDSIVVCLEHILLPMIIFIFNFIFVFEKDGIPLEHSTVFCIILLFWLFINPWYLEDTECKTSCTVNRLIGSLPKELIYPFTTRSILYPSFRYGFYGGVVSWGSESLCWMLWNGMTTYTASIHIWFASAEEHVGKTWSLAKHGDGFICRDSAVSTPETVTVPN